MPSLDPTLRKSLENKIPTVRQIAEEAARAILNTLAVNRLEPFPGMSPEQRKLRNALRAKARQLGEGGQTAGFEPLVEELAYQQWHRMVFARFLAENQLLMHPSGVPVSLAECGELAQEEGEADAWAVAAKYAALMLPGIFRPDDPESAVRLTPEGLHKLETALNAIEPPVFLADDALGWMYQFWQKLKKDEINQSERKIGGADLSPVTQLFTEDYMVSFLLENSLGAWWAARHPGSPLIQGWKYLRFKEDGTPAAGTFPGWPERAALVTMMDPCFGSGHILVAGFHMLSAMRKEEEGLSTAAAGDAVLRDNLFGLELDPRCTQIGAFALALAAWKSGGYRPLPLPNLACSGIPVQGQLDTWLKLAGDDSRVRTGLERLYNLFKNAPDLGSLINPSELPASDRMFIADYDQVLPALEKALATEDLFDDQANFFIGETTEGIKKVAKLLVNQYFLVITNVPYLTRNKQGDVLKDFCETIYPDAKADLATVFIDRCRKFTKVGGSHALVAPQNWLFLSSYKTFRIRLLKQQAWNMVIRLGSGATATASWEKIRSLSIISNYKGDAHHLVSGVNAFAPSDEEKANLLLQNQIMISLQDELLRIPDSRIVLSERSSGKLLQAYAQGLQGVSPADGAHYKRGFWEIEKISNEWTRWQSTFIESQFYGGRDLILWTNSDFYNAVEDGTAYIRGQKAWGRKGIVVKLMGKLPVTIYTGEWFDTNVAIILPFDDNDLEAIWAFCSSKLFQESVRKLDQKLNVTNATLVKVPFDLDYWQKVADEAGPLPEPHSDDPTQWIFKGHPDNSTEPLQVAVARLLGYEWPQQEKDGLNTLKEEDGIVCLVPSAGERPLAERLREVLAAAYGSEWSPKLQAELLSSAGPAGKSLEDWLRDDFYASHCRLFQNRPFLWHIWDGRKDGFSALVNYHKLNSVRLDKLIFTFLGDWIRFQRARRDHGEPGADGRLVAALDLERKLKLIKEGEPPYDIYVRWKTLAQQPIGWDPDLNDGVRLNIRPFVTAGVLRSKFTINWNKDRGANPDGSERLNDKHFSIAEKIEARKNAN